jgi:two-component system, cell cycle sensor histidine kinase and response regulator CckA
MPKILLVDDDASVLNMLSRALTSYELMTARDGAEALAVANGKPLDLLITDYLMPVMTGDELIERMRAARPDLKCLVITGFGDVLEREGRGWWQDVAHLAKPFRIQALRETVATLLAA